MNLDDTIVAIATPPGRGGIGVVRLAGAEARSIVAPMLRTTTHRPFTLEDFEAGRARFAELVEPSALHPEHADAPAAHIDKTLRTEARRIDEVVVTFFARPHSYTTDDIVEISGHGSPVVLRHILELAVARGARLAEPGEFTMRAFLNGRIDLTQAEAVRDLIDAQTLYQAQVAALQLEGALSHRIAPIKQKLTELIALLEAGIDFADDDVPVAPAAQILDGIAAVRAPLERLAASFAYGKLVHEGVSLAIVGRPNVGKSSIFNCLVERERAIVTATPGTTRDLVTETVAIGGIPVRLIDTAGIRHAHDEAESIGVRKSREAMADADLVLLVMDMSQALTAEDAQLAATVAERPHLMVLNKADLVADGQRADVIGWATSAITGEGIAELRAALLKKLGGDGAQVETGFLTNVRHQGLVRDSLQSLANAVTAVETNVPHEMLLLDLYGALRPLDEITGATTAEDILSLIFGTFCIGK